MKIEDALDEMRQKMHSKGRLAKHFKEMAETKREERLLQNTKVFNEVENVQAGEFIAAETIETIQEIVNDPSEIDALLMPPPGLKKSMNNPTPAGLGLRDRYTLVQKSVLRAVLKLPL